MVDLYAQFRARKYFASLDGLRCISILAVIWHHTHPHSLNYVPVADHGYLGVDLFFVISGFLITTLLLRERASRGRISLKSFYIRRTLRIFPLYYATILLYVAVVLKFERNDVYGLAFFRNLPAFLTYTSNWFVSWSTDRVIFYFAWSLAAEEQFYLFWPSVEKRLGSAAASAVMVATLAFVTAASAGLLGAVLPAGTLPNKIVTSFPVAIGLGVLLAHLLHERRGYEWTVRVFGHRGSALAMLAVLVFAVVQPKVSPWLTHGTMAALVASTVMREDHWLAPVLRWRPIVHVGVVSYGMYLIHTLCWHFVSRVLARVGLVLPLAPFFVTVAVAVAAATLSHRYYESFFLRLKDQLDSRRAPVASVNAAAPQ